MKNHTSITNNVLQDIIARCHQRHKQPLKQRKSIVTPWLYKEFPYHFTVYCAHRYPVMLQDLGTADISFMPIGQVPGNDRPPRDFGGRTPLETSTGGRLGKTSNGINRGEFKSIRELPPHAMAHHGTTSTFTYEALCAAPDAVLACVQALIDAVANPLLVLSKSGGAAFLLQDTGVPPPKHQAGTAVCS